MRLILLFVLTTLLAACKQPEALTAKQVLDSVYSQYDTKHACWIAQDPDGMIACMKLDSEKLLHLPSGDRLYVLVAGDLVDEQHESNGAHASPGSVGAFVAETIAGKTMLIASNSAMANGTMGTGPFGWKLVQLGPKDYWGWQGGYEDCHQGYCGSYYSILAPYGKTIKDVGFMTASFDNSGAVDPEQCAKDKKVELTIQRADDSVADDAQDEDVCQQPSIINSTLKIDTSNQHVKVYPLKITVTGISEGQAIKPATYSFEFDIKKWQYIEPKDYALIATDF